MKQLILVQLAFAFAALFTVFHHGARPSAPPKPQSHYVTRRLDWRDAHFEPDERVIDREQDSVNVANRRDSNTAAEISWKISLGASQVQLDRISFVLDTGGMQGKGVHAPAPGFISILIDEREVWKIALDRRGDDGEFWPDIAAQASRFIASGELKSKLDFVNGADITVRVTVPPGASIDLHSLELAALTTEAGVSR
jgi:hypothetical protein